MCYLALAALRTERHDMYCSAESLGLLLNELPLLLRLVVAVGV